MKYIPCSAGQFVPASHENPDRPGVFKRVIATHSDLITGQVMMVNWARLPAGSAFRSHFHEDMQEVFVLIHGSVVMTVDGSQVSLLPGDTVIVDATEVHEMQNLSAGDAEYLVFGVSSGEGGQTVVVDGPLQK